MKNLRKDKDYWKPCKPGTILNASNSKLRQERRKFMVRSVMGGIVMGSATLSALFVLSHQGKKNRVAEKQEPEQDLGTTPVQDSSPMIADASSNSDESLDTFETTIRFTCSDIQANLDQYVSIIKIPDFQLPAEQLVMRNDFKQHVSVCSDCRAFVDEAIKNA